MTEDNVKTIKFEGEYFDEKKYLDRVYLNPNNIGEELAKNPSWIAYYGSQVARWDRAVDTYKMQRDERASEIIVELKDSGEKGMTDKYIEARTKVDDEFKKHSKNLRLAREQAQLYKNAHFAMDKKQFSLQAMNNRSMAEENHSKAISYQGAAGGTLEEKKQALLDVMR